MLLSKFKKKPLAAAVSVGVVGLVLGLGGCGNDGDTGPAGPAGADATADTMSFTAVSVPTTDAEKRLNRASPEVTVNDTTYAIGHHTLVRTNDVLPKLGGAAGETAIFGAWVDKSGAVMTDAQSNPIVCSNGSGPDHTSMLTFGGKLFAVTQLECALGGAYVTELNQDGNGLLTAVSTRPVDFSAVRGTYVNCAGVTTSWDTHLGSEEYEPPMAKFDASAADGAWFNDPTWHDLHMETIADYNGVPNDAAHAAHFGYYYGWTPEISITSTDGNTSVVKHYAMGRFSHELAYVMPDDRTVYLSDDGTNVGLFMFVADTARDLSAGTLYAAKWIQESGAGAGAAALAWINLGHATDAQVDALLSDDTVTFDTMWNKADPNPDNTCPAGFTSTNTYDAGQQCVSLKAGQDLAASRLETRLYAAYKGATTEFRKEEGITFNPDDNVLYVAMSEIAKGMLDDSSSDVGGPNHIRLDEANKCGAVYSLDVVNGVADTDGNAINSDYVVGDMYGIVSGEYVGADTYAGTPYEAANNDCSVNAISMPDNISYLPKYGMLLIGEDTSHHQNDMVWAYNVRTAQLQRIATTPYGSETTSPFWHTNIGGHGYITMVTQHPYEESDTDEAGGDLTLMESYVGYIGPFPALDQ